MTIADILHPEDVLLDLTSTDSTEAIEEVAKLLKNDERVLDWTSLLAGFHKAAPCLPASKDFAICIPHTRTDSLTSLVMSVGRSAKGIRFPNTEPPVRYIFCIGVQHALAADYLRIVGLLARVLKDPASEQRLLSATTGLEFADTLARLEAKL